MTAKTVINTTYSTLKAIGVVDSKSEFYKDWLHKSDSYIRVLNCKNLQPSTNTLAVCSSKLKYYGDMLVNKSDKKRKGIGKEFIELSKNLDNAIIENCKKDWFEKYIHKC